MKRKKKKLMYVFIALIVLAIFFSGCYYQRIKQVSPLAEEEQKTEVKINNISIKEEDDKTIINILYPETNDDGFNQKIKGFVDENIANLKKAVNETDPSFFNGEIKYELYIDYYFDPFSDAIYSFKFNTYSYAGGVHGMLDIFCLTYNFADSKKVELSDLFLPNSNFLEKISNLSIEKLKKEEFADTEWVNEGAGPKIENFQRFSLTKKELFFYFPPYQVGSYSSGEKQTRILLKDLKDILKPEVLARADLSETEEKGIFLFSLNPGDTVSSPLKIAGYINGNGWIAFEGQAGTVELTDLEGKVIASGLLSATSSWMELPVIFNTTLIFDKKDLTQGNLIFHNENPSGLESNNRESVIPIKFIK